MSMWRRLPWANMNQAMKAILQLKATLTSLIIAYACISHSIKSMGTSMAEEKKTVEAGYWHLYRYNPVYVQGRIPLSLILKILHKISKLY